MNITRNNYEEYFLLYADGELSSSDRHAVANFVELHPDLAAELDLLMETVLNTADIRMPGKHLLLKPEEWTEDTLTPNQQNMLLLLDDELPAGRAAQLQKAIATDPRLHNDWAVLQQTKLVAQAIAMPEKEQLFRRERDRKPIPIGWVKWMAAAAIIAGLGWYSISFFNRSEQTDTGKIAVVTKPKTDNTKAAVAITPVPNNRPVANTTTDNMPEQKAQQTAAAGEKEKLSAVKKGAEVTVAVFKHKEKPTAVTKKQPLISPDNKPVVYVATQNLTLAANKNDGNQQTVVVAKTTVVPDSKNIEPAVPATALKEQNEYASITARQAVYKEDGFAEPEYVTIAGAHIKKQKLRSIFRNVTRTVGRTFDKSNVAQADVVSLNK